MYAWFAASLLIVIILNALLIQLMHSILIDWNKLIQQSVVLIVPWILLLFLPSVLIGMVIYSSLVKRYRLTLFDSQIQIDRINSKKKAIGPSKKILWSDMKEFKFSDFEDNEYFTLIFHDKGNNLILHRNTGEFELFFEELKKYVK
jgi:hypothetical protein